jgi:hypothetical protein
MRTSRRFRPMFEYMSARIAPSTATAIDPTEDGTVPETTPVVDPDDPTTAPSGSTTGGLIISPAPITVGNLC